MGAWGAGNFENDDALDLIGELKPQGCAEQLEALFCAAVESGMQGAEIDAFDASRVLAGAELVAASRGHASEDFPEDAAPLAQALQKPSGALLEQCASAVSYVLLSSEMVELWAESDDPAEWNEVVTALIARLDAPVRAKKTPAKQQDEATECVCSFCGEQLAANQIVHIDMRRPWTPTGMSRGIFAHETCLNAKLHPRHLVQWWTPDVDL